VNVYGQLVREPPRHRMPEERGPESKRPSTEVTLWQDPTRLEATFHVTVSPGWTLTVTGA